MAKAFADANKTAFDVRPLLCDWHHKQLLIRQKKLAAEYDSRPWLKQSLANVKEGLQNNLDFIGASWVTQKNSPNAKKQCRLLDYACGPGTVSLVCTSSE